MAFFNGPGGRWGRGGSYWLIVQEIQDLNAWSRVAARTLGEISRSIAVISALRRQVF